MEFAGYGSHFHPVLGGCLEFDYSSGHQTGQMVSQEVVEIIAIQAAKVSDRAVIDLDAATNPPISIVLLCPSRATGGYFYTGSDSAQDFGPNTTTKRLRMRSAGSMVSPCQ